MRKKLVLVSRNLVRGREPKERITIVSEDDSLPATRPESEFRVFERSDVAGDVFATCGEERRTPKRYRM